MPAQIVRHARERGVRLQPVCVVDSEWDTKLVNQPRGGRGSNHVGLPFRLGLRIVHSVAAADAARIVAARQVAQFASVEDIFH